MDKSIEIELFDYLSRQQKLREWLTGKIEADYKVLAQANDIDQIRKAQGRVSLAQQMLDLMDAAPSALAKKR